jgi:hypothetical protein
MPVSVLEIEADTFSGCTALTKLTLSPNTSTLNYRFITGTAIECISIPSSVTSTPNYATNPSSYSGWGINNDFYYGAEYGYGAFTGATALKEVIFEDGRTVIPAYALYTNLR